MDILKLDEDTGIFEMTIVDLDARVKQTKSLLLEAAKKEEEDPQLRSENENTKRKCDLKRKN